MSEAEYEALQASKLGDSFGAANASASQKRMEGYIRRFDAQIAHELLEYLQRPTIQHCVLSPVLCVGARLGGEVHAFQLLPQVSLAVGVDLNPGLRNPHVLYGDGQRLEQFKNASFGTIFTNVLDHVLKIEKFAAMLEDPFFPSTNAGGFSYLYNGGVGPLFRKTVLPFRFGTWICASSTAA